MKEFCKAEKLTQAPKFIKSSSVAGRRFLIMEFLPYDVDEYIIRIEAGKSRDDAIQRVALGMLDAVVNASACATQSRI